MIVVLIFFFCSLVYSIRRRFDVQYGALDNDFEYEIIQDPEKRDYCRLMKLPSKGLGHRSSGRIIFQGSKAKIKSYLKWDDQYCFNTKNIALIYT